MLWWIKDILFVAWMSITLALLGIIIYVFPLKSRQIRRSWAKSTLAIFGIKPKLIGLWDENARLLIVNHQSLLDIVVIEALHPANLCWVAKKQIADIPIYGHILKSPKMIAIDREDKAGLVRLLSEAKNRLSEGRVLSIFPEGTRSGGSEMLPFKGGARILAEKLQLCVQPIVVVDSSKILDTKNYKFGRRILKSGELCVIAMPTVDTSAKGWFEHTRAQMQTTLQLHRSTCEDEKVKQDVI